MLHKIQNALFICFVFVLPFSCVCKKREKQEESHPNYQKELFIKKTSPKKISPKKTSQREQVTLSGFTFGTSFTIKIFLTVFDHETKQKIEDVRNKIQKKLQKIDLSMSTWRDDSEIQRFNKDRGQQPFPVSMAFLTVLKEAKKIYMLTSGAFDPAREEVFLLWGFGVSKNKGGGKKNHRIPKSQKIKRAMERSGLSFLKIFANERWIQKEKPLLQINLSAIAKGYAVDEVAIILEEEKFFSYMVEIGGEVRVGRKKGRKLPWHIAIEKPNYEGKRLSLYRIVRLVNMSMASSGEYRNYFRRSNRLYSHILDPRTGHPVQNNIIAVTVVGPLCMRSDALATSLMVLSLKQGKRLVEKQKGYEALWIVDPNRLSNRFSNNVSQNPQKRALSKNYVTHISSNMDTFLLKK